MMDIMGVDSVFFTPGANKIRVAAVVCLIFGITQVVFAGSVSAVMVDEIIGSWYGISKLELYCLFLTVGVDVMLLPVVAYINCGISSISMS